MATPYQKVYDSFLAKVKEDEWTDLSEIDYYIEDWCTLLHSALAFFKFPRFDTTLDDENNCFPNADLTSEEIEILANLMKQEWLDRIINSWDQVKVMYDERDFSPANMVAQLIKLSDATYKKTRILQKNYSRSITKNGMKNPFDYTRFGGSQE